MACPRGAAIKKTQQCTLVEPVGDAVVDVLLTPVVCDLDGSRERVELEVQVIIVDERLQQIKQTQIDRVNSVHWYICTALYTVCGHSDSSAQVM